MSRADREPPLSERFEQALAYAARLHRGQWRRAQPVPYVGHLLGVAALVIDDGGDEDEVIAALLHDAVEDQGGARTLGDITEHFGPRVAAIVAACSEAESTEDRAWRERKQQHVDRLRTADPSVRRVYAADKLNNLRSLDQGLDEGVDVWSLFRGGREGTLWYLRGVLEALRAAGGGAMVERFARELGTFEGRLATQGPRP